MSVIEDTRKLLQDFLAPELRELSARVDALEVRMNDRFDSIEKRMDAAEHLASERHGQTLQAIARLADIYELRERISRIEAKEKAN
ncbi:MAG: hypothetical protein WBE76_08445 [Terracidiphilus sp.]